MEDMKSTYKTYTGKCGGSLELRGFNVHIENETCKEVVRFRIKTSTYVFGVAAQALCIGPEL